MKRVVLESPYGNSDPKIVLRNIAYARRCLHDCLVRSEAPIASHLLFTQPGVLDDNIPEERALGIAAGLAWIPVADAVVFYTDYGVSKGMTAAMEAAMAAKIPLEIRPIGKNPEES